MVSTLPPETRPNLAIESFLHSVFQAPASEKSMVIAFTSAHAGEGVSYVSRKIARQLAESRSDSVIHVQAARMDEETWPRHLRRPEHLTRYGETAPGNGWEDWRTRVQNLRARYRYTLVDCPSLAGGSEGLSLAPHVDGIVLVVAADSTRKAQIAHAERQIQMSGGTLLGTILNKREYLIPGWLHRRL
jgi:Mrp family chromosome partitioning ATPase